MENIENKEIKTNISVEDLRIMFNLIENLHKRNAFELDELATVGILYTRLKSFLKQAEEILNKKSEK